MKIKSLYIPDFFILEKFRIDFLETKDIAVIIGDNGSGKSTLLEVIAYIFGHLHKYFVLEDKTADFIDGYEIIFNSEYKGKNYEIYLKSVYVMQQTNTFKPIIRINSKDKTIQQIENEFGGFKNFLPSRIGIYYAGEATYLRKLSEHFEDKFIKDIIRDNNPYSLSPLKLPNERPFFYMKREYLSIIFLSLAINSNENEEIQLFLKDIVGDFDVSNIEINISLKKPKWANKRNEKLWGINSKLVEEFIDALNKAAGNVNHKEDSLIYTFWGLLDLIPLFKNFSKEMDFPFIILDTILYNDLLDEIVIEFKNAGGGIINIERLSEGQRQKIVTCGLNLLWMNKSNKLLLFDEPDTYLHPKWQSKFISDLNFYNGQCFITTHSPTIVNHAKTGELFLMERGKIIEHSKDFYGRDANSILKYFMNAPKRPYETDELIEKVSNLITSRKYNEAETTLNKLIEIVGDLDPQVVKLGTKIAFYKR